MLLAAREELRIIWMGEMLLEVLSETILNPLQNHQILGQCDCQSVLRKIIFA